MKCITYEIKTPIFTIKLSANEGKLIPLKTEVHLSNTRWSKYDREKLWLVYTQIVPVIFEPPCIWKLGLCRIVNTLLVHYKHHLADNANWSNFVPYENQTKQEIPSVIKNTVYDGKELVKPLQIPLCFKALNTSAILFLPTHTRERTKERYRRNVSKFRAGLKNNDVYWISLKFNVSQKVF
jgi:hypothetical protein